MNSSGSLNRPPTRQAGTRLTAAHRSAGEGLGRQLERQHVTRPAEQVRRRLLGVCRIVRYTCPTARVRRRRLNSYGVDHRGWKNACRATAAAPSWTTAQHRRRYSRQSADWIAAQPSQPARAPYPRAWSSRAAPPWAYGSVGSSSMLPAMMVGMGQEQCPVTGPLQKWLSFARGFDSRPPPPCFCPLCSRVRSDSTAWMILDGARPAASRSPARRGRANAGVGLW